MYLRNSNLGFLVPVAHNSIAFIQRVTPSLPESAASRSHVTPQVVLRPRRSVLCMSAPKERGQGQEQENEQPILDQDELARVVRSELGVEDDEQPILDQDAITQQLRSKLAADGINFDDLLDSSKAVTLARNLQSLEVDIQRLAPGSTAHSDSVARLATMRTELATVSRQIMQPLLKKVFILQAVISALAGGFVAANAVPGVADMPLVGRALGFWTVWLFSIPSLRARKGIAKYEKSALNVAFLLTPLLNLVLPLITKDCARIWAAEVAVLIASYAYYFAKAANTPDDVTNAPPGEQSRIRGILRYLDWGSWR